MSAAFLDANSPATAENSPRLVIDAILAESVELDINFMATKIVA
jgi:hypothetical protein